MTKIKYIHCLGTSHTAGGGFEFESTHPDRVSMVKKYYSDVDSPNTQFNFSYPGQLQKLFGKDIKVFNHAKQGCGNDRMYRIAYDLITDPHFKRQENIFVFEFSGIGRTEFYLNSIHDFITINYQHKINEKGDLTKDGVDLIGLSHSYFYETEEFLDYVKENTKFYENIVKNFINYDVESTKIFRDSEFFISYLEKCKINFYYTVPPIVCPEFEDETKNIVLGDGIYFKKNNNILQFSSENNLTIKDETNNQYEDDHNSFKSNKLVAHIVYNKILTDHFNDIQVKEINWEWYKKTNFVEYGK
jgi:hypothetical protein